MSFIKYETNAVQGTDWHRIISVFPTAALAYADTGEGVVAESAKDIGRDVGPASVGWFTQPTNAHAIAENLPSRTDVAGQRTEIYDILREATRRYNNALFGYNVTWQRYLRMIIAYTKASTTNAQLDKCKTAARTDPNEFALYANATSWGALNTTAGLYIFEKPEPLTPGTGNLPAAETGTPTVAIGTITGTNVAEELI